MKTFDRRHMGIQFSVWKETFRIRQFEIDTDGFGLITAIANYLQEAAGAHADSLGWSMQSLLDRNMGWILHRFTIDIRRYPKAGEEIQIVTWPSGADRLFAYRDFELFDMDGNMILSARTAWLILDIARRRPIPTPPDVVEIGAQSDRGADIQIDTKLPKPDGDPVRMIPITVRRSDLDINRHVNNVRYLEWAMETLYEDDLNVRPFFIDIQFKAESKYGDSVSSERYVGENGSHIHRIVRIGDGKELCIAHLRTHDH